MSAGEIKKESEGSPGDKNLPELSESGCCASAITPILI